MEEEITLEAPAEALDAEEIPTAAHTAPTASPTLKRWEQPRGPIQKGDRIVIGKVGAPPLQEATSGRFFFWVPPEAFVEQTQVVRSESEIAGQPLIFYAIVDEVYRRSRKANMGGEFDEADGDLAYEPPFLSDGFTYAEASILRVIPPARTPPRERSDVFLIQDEEAGIAYFADEVDDPLAVGLVKNGGDRLAGAGAIDLDYLLGENGGHMIVNGTSGRGSKSSFLLFVIWMLLRLARRQALDRPSDEARRRIVPIILNIKNFDLFHIDLPSGRYVPERHATDWGRLGVDDPHPFRNVTFYAAQQPGGDAPVPTGRVAADVLPFSWGLADVIERGLLEYLFAEADANDTNFSALVLDIAAWLTHECTERDGDVSRSMRSDKGQPDTFGKLLSWVQCMVGFDEGARPLKGHHTGTWQKLYRRLLKLIYESKGVLRRDETGGHPLDVVRTDTCDPIVIDLAALAGEPELQRFVVATIFRQLVAARTGASAVRGLTYLVMVDELNRFAPRSARDPITRLIEMVAAEMRSQGIILLGAQQQASKVSEKVIENAGIRVLGRTGSLELSTSTWRFLSESARRKAESLTISEKLVVQDNFREPMHVHVPFPVWAMNPREASIQITHRHGASPNGHAVVDDAELIDR